MPEPTLNFGSFTPTELAARLVTAKEEYFNLVSSGRIIAGSSSAQQYTIDKMKEAGLIRLINGLTSALGLDNSDILRARPNFNTSRGRCDPYGGQVGI